MVLMINAEVTGDGGIGETWTGPPFSTPAKITDTFGHYPDWRKNFDHDGDPSTPGRDFGPHKGVDCWVIAGPEMQITAADDGEVFWTQRGHPTRGNYVVITHHTNEAPNEPIPATYYLHLNDILVSAGDSVVAGQPIGIEGWTGAVTGRHLHFAVQVGDQYVDPLWFLRDLSPFPIDPTPGAFTPAIAESGISLTIYAGGTVAELEAELAARGATSASVGVQGAWVVLVVGAPAFVNQEFANGFTSGVPAGTPIAVVMGA